jgi:predicted RNA-binding protein YlxR (DUF448 family)
MKKIPQRQCTGCREMKNKTDMIRVIRTPEGEIRIDETGKMNGRGAYICRSLSCLKASLGNHGLERSLHTRIPGEICQQLEEEMKKLER